MLNTIERREELIQQAIKAGVTLSRFCRNCWTGERTRANIEAARIVHWMALLALAHRGERPLIDYADVADLHGIIYLGRADQHTWDARRWEKELRARMNDEASGDGAHA